MALTKILVANRGEIAIRILRTAAEMGLGTVAVFSEDDAQALHLRQADEAHPLAGAGVPPYCDVDRLLAIARATGCDGLHPGYGFLSENAAFARRCAEAGIAFVGPGPDILETLGDKVRALALARQCGVPVLAGSGAPVSLKEARAFLAGLRGGAAMLIKAVAGGGGRGLRVVRQQAELEAAYAQASAEAERAFGDGSLYAETFLPRARHVEVQIAGDGTGAVIHLGERDCSLQRRHQKLVEIAPSPALAPALRERLTEAAVAMARACAYRNLGTFEFLVDEDDARQETFAFIEANPRLQVEHTVTEAVLGLDLVRVQLQIAGGATLAELELEQAHIPAPRGFAIQLRVNMEVMDGEGNARPSGGVLSAFEPPAGPGVRVDTFGYPGYRPSAAYDSLLAKVIAHSPSPGFEDAVARAYRALCEFRIEGVATNLPLLQNLLRNPDFAARRVHTRFVEEHSAALAAVEAHPARFADKAPAAPHAAGARVDPLDPLAVLAHGKSSAAMGSPSASTYGESAAAAVAAPDGTVPVLAPMQGTIVSVDAKAGDALHEKGAVLVMESMKMHHVIPAGQSGVLRRVVVQAGDTVYPGSALAFIEPGEVKDADAGEPAAFDPQAIRDDLAEVLRRQAMTRDEARPEAVARRRKTGQRTARENIADLCDPGSFVEYGSLVIAARRARASVEELMARTPADGLVAGIGRVNGDRFGESASRCMVMSYDYTVLAGTQGKKNHEKKDRLFELAEKLRLPLVLFTEGGGGRPGDTDGQGVADLHIKAFHLFARLSGAVPLLGINSGRCFAGNAALLGCCDVVIATANSSIGMGGPAMIEGGGLGVFRPEEVGPMPVQVPNGVVDLPVADEAEAVAVAKRYLSYFQGPVADWTCADQRLLRGAVPEDRLRIYDVREVVRLLADEGSVLELRRHFGLGMVTALARIEGRPVGILANNPAHLGGAIDPDGADKAARFTQLCDAFDLPLVVLIDTPGMMVGPEIEKRALVRHCCRLFVNGANATIPMLCVVLRKAYGLGAQAMVGGSLHFPLFTVSWPTGEFGGMGLEGAVKLGYRNELAAIEDPAERKRRFDEMVAEAYARGKALSTASHFELDDVIDPAETRARIVGALGALPPKPPRTEKKRTHIETW